MNKKYNFLSILILGTAIASTVYTTSEVTGETLVDVISEKIGNAASAIKKAFSDDQDRTAAAQAYAESVKARLENVKNNNSDYLKKSIDPQRLDTIVDDYFNFQQSKAKDDLKEAYAHFEKMKKNIDIALSEI